MNTLRRALGNQTALRLAFTRNHWSESSDRATPPALSSAMVATRSQATKCWASRSTEGCSSGPSLLVWTDEQPPPLHRASNRPEPPNMGRWLRRMGIDDVNRSCCGRRVDASWNSRDRSSARTRQPVLLRSERRVDHRVRSRGSSRQGAERHLGPSRRRTSSTERRTGLSNLPGYRRTEQRWRPDRPGALIQNPQAGSRNLGETLNSDFATAWKLTCTRHGPHTLLSQNRTRRVA